MFMPWKIQLQWKFVGMALILLGSLFLEDALLRSGARRNMNGQSGIWSQAMRGTLNADLLLAGSSRAAMHLAPIPLTETTGLTSFNIGLMGTGLHLQFGFLQAYLKHNRHPKIILQGLDINSLTWQATPYQPDQYLPYLSESSVYQAFSDLMPGAWKIKHVPLYGFLMLGGTKPALRSWFRNDPDQQLRGGFQGVDLAWTDEFDQFRRQNPNGLELPIDSRSVEDLENLVRYCTELGIRIILVYSPEYYEVLPLIKNRKSIMETYRRIAEKHHIPFWDYSTSEMGRDRSLFFNSQHLNLRGAERFSRELGIRLSRIIGGSAESAQGTGP
jgi:hypothetical protein